MHPRTLLGKLIAEAELINQARPGDVALQEALRFWTVDFPALHGRTRSIILADFTALTDLLHDPVLHELLGSETTITPEAVFEGAVIVIDLPIEKWLSIGRMAQLVWKHFLQLTVRRRGDADDASRRPVFLWADEFQNFLSGETDAAFQATARSARCATVYLTQTIPGLYIQAGASLPAERTDALLANLCTKFIHASNDPRTNEWAATQIGKSTQYRASVSSGDEAPTSGWGLMDWLTGGSRSKTTTSPVIDYEVQPSEFAKLATGGKRYRGIVEVFILKSGACFSTGKHWLRTGIVQEAFA